jgi:glutathione synthase/RimK-type ligase-like ATP-grasp enzyme
VSSVPVLALNYSNFNKYMPTKYRIYPYKIGSASAKALAQSLGGWCVYSNKRFPARKDHKIINWGNTENPTWRKPDTFILNKPECVALATNKLSTFERLAENGVPVPDYTTDYNVAQGWVNDGSSVYVRKVLNGHGGNGIEVCRGGILPRAHLYTKAITVKAEYRVHVFNGKVIDYAKKRRRIDDVPNEDQLSVRNHENGWIFTRENLRRLERVEQMAINAIKSLGLDFGSCDIVRDINNDCFVLEVNTASGIEGTTLENYTNAIREFYGQ